DIPATDLLAKILHRTFAAACAGQRTHDGVEQSGLARAVTADDGDNTALRDGDVGVEQGVNLAVLRAKVVDLQHRLLLGRAHAVPPAVAGFSGVSNSRSSSMPPR